MSVAAFLSPRHAELAAAGVERQSRSKRRAERDRPIRSRLPEDTLHAAYDAPAAAAFWRALVRVDRVFRLFRSGFLGKASSGALLLGAASTSR
jgi:hypothetical protein